MSKVRVYFSLGSNLGDRLANLQKGVDSLKAISDDNSIIVSRVYETVPWGKIAQPLFLNCAVAIDCEDSPEDLLDRAQSFEESAGRKRDGGVWEPRVLDIDILLFGDKQIDSERLIVPHRFLLDRKFVLLPLCEIAAEENIPGTKLTVSQALEECSDELDVSIFEDGLKS